MPVDFNTAQQLINSRGVQPPPGISPGTSQYQEWATSYLQNAVDAGDPAAMQVAGVQQWKGSYSGTGQNGGWDAGYGAKKLPPPGPNATPAQIRQYSWDQGWGTDDYGDIPDSEIARWIAEGKWDPQAGRFKNDYGDYVDKPTDDGPISAGRQAEFNVPGRYSSPDQVRVPGGASAPAPTSSSQEYNPTDPLQQKLMQMVGSGAGYFGEQGRNNAASLRGGGLWWGQGADFSQDFNPLKPKPAGGGGGGGGAQEQNPFTQAAQVLGTPGTGGAPSGGAINRPSDPFFVPPNVQNGNNFLTNRLYKEYATRGNNSGIGNYPY